MSGVNIKGIRETSQALRAFAPKLQRQFNKEIKSEIGRLKTGAEARYPHGQWEVKMTKRAAQVRTAAGSLGRSRFGDSSPGVRAAIFEFAGKNQPGRSPQAVGMIESLNDRYGTPGRFLWATWESEGDSIIDNVEAAMLRYEAELQAALDAAGEAY